MVHCWLPKWFWRQENKTKKKKTIKGKSISKGRSDFFAIFGDTYPSYSLYTMSDYSWHTYLPQNRTSFLCTFPKVKLKNWVTRHTYGSETKKPINLYSKNSSLSFIVRRWLNIIRHDWTCRIECNLEFPTFFVLTLIYEWSAKKMVCFQSEILRCGGRF